MKKWILFLVLLICTSSFAGDIQQEQSTLYLYKSQIAVQDEFLSGNTTSGSIGSLGWGFSNGVTTQLASETNRPGILRRDTSAVSGTIATTTLYPGSSSFIQGGVLHEVTWIVRLNNNDANTTVRIGSGNSVFGVSPPVAGIYFEKLDADTNWFCVTRNASVETRTDSGIAVNTDFNIFKYRRLDSSVVLSINNTVVCTHTTNILASGFSNPWTLIENSAAASKTMDHDYFQLRIFSLTR